MAAVKKAPAKPLPAPMIGGGAQGGNIGPGLHRNAPPDGRMFRPTPWVGLIERGRIVEWDAGSGRLGPGEVHFMYNPNEFSYQFQLNEQLVDPAATAQIPTAGAMGGTSIGFQIFFSRQFEVAYEGDPHGVMSDIRALKYIVGMKDDKNSYMMLKALRFTLGAQHVFHGYITSMSARLAYFSEKMVPMQAIVDIHATQLPADFDPRSLSSTAATAAQYYNPTTGTTTTKAPPMNRLGPAVASTI